MVFLLDFDLRCWVWFAVSMCFSFGFSVILFAWWLPPSISCLQNTPILGILARTTSILSTPPGSRQVVKIHHLEVVPGRLGVRSTLGSKPSFLLPWNLPRMKRFRRSVQPNDEKLPKNGNRAECSRRKPKSQKPSNRATVQQSLSVLNLG
jgi:hypothetical protein